MILTFLKDFIDLKSLSKGVPITVIRNLRTSIFVILPSFER
jgi:hypothetical protein